MNDNQSIMPDNTGIVPSNPSISQPGKMKINPLQLLTALSILLNVKGGIKSIEEVKRVSGLMSKYSKKLVSKCIYLNILEATDASLLNHFYTEDGWKLVCTWLTDAIKTYNWPLTKQILNLLLVSPVTVERLKQNNSPKMVKDLSRDCDNNDVKVVAEQVVQNWKLIVAQGVLSTLDSKAISQQQPESAIQQFPNVVKEDVSETTTIDQSVLIEDNNTSTVPTVDVTMEQLPAKRGRATKVGRGRGRQRGRPKAEAPSYAELLKQDLDNLSGPEVPINITIRNGPKLLVKVSSKKVSKPISNSSAIDSTDSEDNIPLSLIRKEVKSTPVVANDAEEPKEVISIESSDSQALSDASSVSTEKAPSIGKNKVKSKDQSSSKVDNKAKIENQDSSKKKSRSVDSQAKDKERSHRSKDKDRSHKSKDNSDRSTDKSKTRDKYKDSDRHRDKTKDRERIKDRDKKSEHRSKDKERSKDKHRLESSKTSSSKSSSRDKRIEEEKEPPKYIAQDQTKLDQATLDKVKPLSTEGLAKIPRKPSSFLDALGAADSEVQDQKKPAIKTKSRGFRNTGLLDETIKPPGMAGKRTMENVTSPTIKRQRLPDLIIPDKRLKSSVSSDPAAIDRPGGIKLISPKRPTIADDGGFMAALTAAGADRKKISKKRRSSETDPKQESGKIIKLDPEDPAVDSKISNNRSPSIDETTTQEPMLSPTSIRPTLNFYKETLKDDSDEPNKETGKEEVVNSKEENDSDKLVSIESSNSVDEPMECGEDEAIESKNDVSLEHAVPAPVQEDYETIEVMHTSLSDDHLKSVLVDHRRSTTKRKKKVVQWKTEESLTQTFFFPMDDTERVNVNTLKFQDMMQKDRAFEKETLGKSRGRFGSPDLNPNPVNTCTEFLTWKLYAIHLPEESTVIFGYKSKERHIQTQREHQTMELFFHPAMRPDTPSEPDAELVPRSEPVSIPLTDVSGSDSFSDHRNIPWPEPVIHPPEMPFLPPPPPQNTLPSHEGGHWIVGSHPTPRFGGDIFNGPPGVCGPPLNHPSGGFPGQNFNSEMRGPPCPPGNWVGMGPPPNEFGGPMLMSGGPPPHMNMGPNMGGPPMGGPGPGMNMGGPLMANRGGPRFKRGNWGPQQNSRPCKHFMNGHCRNGNNCRFAHNQPR